MVCLPHSIQGHFLLPREFFSSYLQRHQGAGMSQGKYFGVWV